jgi:CBS domain-containing protein
MWWPAIGALAVGLVGLWQPRTLGVGYDNIEDALSGNVTVGALAALCAAKFVSWAIALGSGTSGGTLAPLMTFGSGMGWLLANGVAHYFPDAGIDPRVAALVGMTAMFAGASRALMASIAFALESTQEIHAVVPIVSGVSVAYFASCLMMRTTIMTEKLARRGVRVAGEYDVDPLAQVAVGSIASRQLRVLKAEAFIADAIGEIRSRAERHQAYPVIKGERLIGVVTARELLAAQPMDIVERLVSRKPVTVTSRETARSAAERMAKEDVGRVIVVHDTDSTRAIGIVTRSDIVAAIARGSREARPANTPEGL